jgi:hypothetical protein
MAFTSPAHVTKRPIPVVFQSAENTHTRLTVGRGSGQRHRALQFESRALTAAVVLGLRLDGIKAALSHRLFQVDDDSLDAAR